MVRRANDLETVFKFHRTIKIEAGANICVWSVDCGATHNPPSNIVMKTQKWPVGDNMVTLLISNDGEVHFFILKTFKSWIKCETLKLIFC